MPRDRIPGSRRTLGALLFGVSRSPGEIRFSTAIDGGMNVAMLVSPTIILNDHEFPAFEWTETSVGDEPPHARDRELLENGVAHLRAGEVQFRCDQTFAFDTTFELKGDGRKFVIISSDRGLHVAKPY